MIGLLFFHLIASVVNALPASGIEEVYGTTTFVTSSGRRLQFVLIYPEQNEVHWQSSRLEENRQYARNLVLNAGAWYVSRIQQEYPELDPDYFAKAKDEKFWLDGRSSYILAIEQNDGVSHFRGMSRFSWRSKERPLAPSEETLPTLSPFLTPKPNHRIERNEVDLWHNLIKAAPSWEQDFVLNGHPFLVPGAIGGEWIEIKNLIVAKGESLDLVPFLLFISERSGLGRSVESPGGFSSFEVRTQDQYFFVAPKKLVNYYQKLGFPQELNWTHPSIRLFISDRSHYLDQLHGAIQSRRGVSELSRGVWETPGFNESDNWRGLDAFMNRDAYLDHLPPIPHLCDELTRGSEL